MSRLTETCESQLGYAWYANLDTFEFDVVGSDSGDVAAGTYNIVPYNSPGAFASFTSTTSTCSESLVVTATGGTVTLTQVSSTSVAGTYDVILGTEGELSGAFD